MPTKLSSIAEFQPALEPVQPASALAWQLAFVKGQLLLPETDAPATAPLQPRPPDWLAAASSRHYLGRLAGHDCWALRLAAVPAGWQALPLRAALLQLGEPLLQLASRAAQLLEWERTHAFCGVCGTATEAQPGERALRCPACGHSSYARISPAMMALVWRRHPQDGRPQLLLARSPHFRPGFYSALAGFVEPGESLEDCLHREVAEEVGLQVRELHYYGSQSWPFPHSLMLAFRCAWAGGEIRPQPGEIEHADWFDLDALPGLPPRFSIAGHLIADTLDWLRP